MTRQWFEGECPVCGRTIRYKAEREQEIYCPDHFKAPPEAGTSKRLDKHLTTILHEGGRKSNE